jgi:hypothetical protein
MWDVEGDAIIGGVEGMRWTTMSAGNYITQANAVAVGRRVRVCDDTLVLRPS